MSAALPRRDVILGCLGTTLGAARAAAAGEPPITTGKVAAVGLPTEVTRTVAAHPGRRPAVLLLHGSKGLAAHLQAYGLYARVLAAAGIDAWLFSYFEPADLAAIGAARDGATRERHYARSADRWVSLVRTIADVARKDDRSSGQVGLFGFSLGGFLGVAAAGEPLFSVLTVFYAGLPAFYRRPITALPPLLDIHGAADRAVPLAQGETLVATAKRLGGVAELAVFPNEGHGFDLVAGNRDAAPARQRAIAFTSRWLT